MSKSSYYVLSGPKDDYNVPKISMGKFIYNCLKQRDPSEPINIDSVTEQTLTNKEILEKSVKLVKIFENLQLKKGDVMALMCENSLNYCTPLLAGFYTGVVVNCLNPSYSAGELVHALKLSRPKVIICSENALENVLKVKKELHFLKTVLLLGSSSKNHADVKSVHCFLQKTRVDVESFEPLDLDPAEDGALILMSSGTTGLPKGALLTHQNLRIAVGYFGHPKFIGVNCNETTVCLVPLFHAFGLFIQISALAYGMKTIIMNKFNPQTFFGSIQKYRVTKLFLVPSLVGYLVKNPLVDNYDISSVKDMIFAAAPLGKDVEEATNRKFQSIGVRQMYGSTEIAGAVTVIPQNRNKPGSSGVLIPAVQVKVRNLDTKTMVGPRQSGELCFKGPMIMKEYVRNPTETKQCFDEDGFYCSGDVGYYDEDGYFYIIGRVKELIKYKGFQVSPAELENLLNTHPGVKDCGVIGIMDERAGQVPLAYVVRQNNVKVTEEEIVDFVAERISAQKHLYGGVKFIEEIPRNPSGKILRRSLMEIYKTSKL